MTASYYFKFSNYVIFEAVAHIRTKCSKKDPIKSDVSKHFVNGEPAFEYPDVKRFTGIVIVIKGVRAGWEVN